MRTIEEGILRFQEQEAKVREERVTLMKLEKEIVKRFCPFKVGDRVIFTEWWRSNSKDYYGIVNGIKFHPSEESIDKKWRLSVTPTTKNFSKPLGGWNASYEYLGKHSADVIRKAEL